MAGYEINAWVVLVLRLCCVIENDVRAFFQMFFKVWIVCLTYHDRRCSLQPYNIVQLAPAEHAVNRALDVADGAGKRYAFADQKIDRQVIESFVGGPRGE